MGETPAEGLQYASRESLSQSTETVTENRRSPGWVRYSGAGLELAGATAGLALVGYWIDGKLDTAPWALLAGVAIGIVGGLYNLVKESLAAMREAGKDDERRE